MLPKIRRGAMHEIADWLDNLGMSEYAERFAENKIDVSVLRSSCTTLGPRKSRVSRRQ